MSGEFVAQVSRVMLLALGPLAAAGGLAAGWRGAVGGLAGGLISLGSFRWIASGVARAAAPAAGSLALTAVAVGVRHLAAFGALALALGSGAAHPVALLVGVSVLPPVLIALGLTRARVAG
jgi:ATP synthase I chain